MTKDTVLVGRITGSLMGIAMKEMACRAMASIARNRQMFVATEKPSYKESQDFLTNADTEAQQIYLRVISESFPSYGVIAEEDNLRTECSEPGTDIYFTVDPLDGTKAFIRRQSHGIGTMISLVQDGEVITACVGDVMTGELYYFRPGSTKVHRICPRDYQHEVLSVKAGKFSDQHLLLGDDPRRMSTEIQDITNPARAHPIFKDIEIMGGSIGLKMARLWKGEVGAVALKAGVQTPWDWCPIAGISAKLGFVLVMKREGEWHPNRLGPIKEMGTLPADAVVVHSSRVTEFIDKILS